MEYSILIVCPAPPTILGAYQISAVLPLAPDCSRAMALVKVLPLLSLTVIVPPLVEPCPAAMIRILPLVEVKEAVVWGELPVLVMVWISVIGSPL